ncbi:hypothetical protein ACFWY6_16380 [Streptomyces sp. NPDC059037]|uniref:hypothetical protein n=1 Tax=Streptomyces sp. NPDC059037 TaxID=3346710 RepID=UPI00367FDC79
MRDAFDEARLVTLVGPGGVGKSCTALRGAGALRERFPDGVWLVELSALGDAELSRTRSPRCSNCRSNPA